MKVIYNGHYNEYQCPLCGRAFFTMTGVSNCYSTCQQERRIWTGDFDDIEEPEEQLDEIVIEVSL